MNAFTTHEGLELFRRNTSLRVDSDVLEGEHRRASHCASNPRAGKGIARPTSTTPRTTSCPLQSNGAREPSPLNAIRRAPPSAKITFAATVTERLFDAAKRPPSAEAHAGVREQASGIAALSAVVEFATGMDIPEHEYHSASARSFFQAAHLAIAWINDIGAFAKDAKDAKEGHHNLVAVHYAMSELACLLLREGSSALRASMESMIRLHGAFVPWLLRSPRYSDLLADEPLITTGNAPDGVEAAPDIAAIAWWWKHLARADRGLSAPTDGRRR
ncbi:terpene synthase family protein [Amycolatopsis mongoliensis]|uniref:Terpene synthase family protein n=1 Tax=Amycolatopsis mongoliensis TaxID=715475 RepID=A0A9Y2JN32_9PSEU|nr:terpene synthase family protein [Amycolatopsis sp. 4-36]WIY01058.1 terpene synthase family protein [Amycolatopsis sp. 4-36]